MSEQNNTPEQTETLLEFPCIFPLKVMGLTHPEFVVSILTAIQEHAPNTTEAHITTRASSKGNYTGATIRIEATSKEQLDNIYLALTSHEMVKVVY
ncbi:YbeD family protein [Neisseria sp. CCUG12390]|uniref:YbeD family protein n=1 Tax=Neisseria sp. CCUG12390 TaxID=3392035 RepID=UPI003A100CF0